MWTNRSGFVAGVSLRPVRRTKVCASAVRTAAREKVCERSSFRDLRGRDWTYGSDVLRAADGADLSAPAIVFVHTTSALGVNRWYWEPLFELLQEQGGGVLSGYEVRCFDWIGTGDAEPKPDRVAEPYTTDDYVSQLAAYVESVGRRVVLVAQGAAEPIALRMAAEHGELLAGLVISTGVSDKYLTTEGTEWKNRLSWKVLTSPLGDLFWNFCATRDFIEGFSRKNVLTSERKMFPWVSACYEGSRDPRTRFAAFSFFSGYLFGDYTGDMARIDVPSLFLAGGRVPEGSIESRLQSARPPVPIQVQEATMRESRLPRLEYRTRAIRNCTGEVIAAGGPDMWYESTEACLPALYRFVSQLQS